MTVNKDMLIRMLSYMRPSGSRTERKFCEVYLAPVCDYYDEHGNYIKIIGKRPNICFTSHYDTVHNKDGFQKVIVEGNKATSDADCLGADCTTGVWLMLGMIEAGVEGVYVFHAAEEIGCVGSRGLIGDYPAWLIEIDFCISFDRFGLDSVITDQAYGNTASDEFARSFAKAVDMPNLKPDPYGVYTDSNEYAGIVPECTNISVGYYYQHTSREYQDLDHAVMLLEKLCNASWDLLEVHRDPTLPQATYGTHRDAKYTSVEQDEIDALEALLSDRPNTMAELLYEYGITLDAIADDLDLQPSDVNMYFSDNNRIYYW